MQWFGHLEKLEVSAWSSKCKTCTVRGSFPGGRPRKTYNEVITRDLGGKKKKKKLAMT